MTTINPQTPGPCRVDTLYGMGVILNDTVTIVQVRAGPTYKITIEEEKANARLLAAAYNAFDKAGRTLNIDAATLADMVIDRLIERDGAL